MLVTHHQISVVFVLASLGCVLLVGLPVMVLLLRAQSGGANGRKGLPEHSTTTYDAARQCDDQCDELELHELELHELATVTVL